MPPVYLDHAATMPMRDSAREAWLEASQLLNPGGQYATGRRARAALEQAREDIASLLDCEPVEVVFTASGTEADNIAIQGLYKASDSRRIVSSPIEHPAALETVRGLAAGAGAEVTWMDVTPTGTVVPGTTLDTPAALVSCMWANNETGAIQPIGDIVSAAAAQKIPVHIDAVQAIGHIPVSFAESGATTLAASAHKFGGPRGTGLLLAARSPAPTGVLFGGGQERGIRPGTADVAGAVATAAALKEAIHEMDTDRQRVADLRDQMRAGILSQVDDVIVHTPDEALPGHLHLSFPGAEGDSLIMLLDSLGIECSTGSACSSGVNRASEVLLAMGVSEHDARGAIRFTLGRTTTSDDVATVLGVIGDVVARARIAGMAG
ncbi:cysteine desulfurase family protein [Corynebacterium durum]|uniref:cysteine desulfurase family protein n=1 Tax=Corynebacterium durum TaxID=61592 RepID=UPI0028EF7E74|nr:cysteine desulfurase family protein [Corynebacterium durum]